MSLTDLEIARAQYLWALHQHGGTLDDQIRDLARVFGVLVRADRQRLVAEPALRLAPAPAAEAA